MSSRAAVPTCRPTGSPFGFKSRPCVSDPGPCSDEASANTFPQCTAGLAVLLSSPSADRKFLTVTTSGFSVISSTRRVSGVEPHQSLPYPRSPGPVRTVTPSTPGLWFCPPRPLTSPSAPPPTPPPRLESGSCAGRPRSEPASPRRVAPSPAALCGFCAVLFPSASTPGPVGGRARLARRR